MSLRSKLQKAADNAVVDKLVESLPSAQIDEKESTVLCRFGALDKMELHRSEEGLYWIHNSEAGVSVQVFTADAAEELANALLEDLEDPNQKGNKQRSKPISRNMVKMGEVQKLTGEKTWKYKLLGANLDLQNYERLMEEHDKEVKFLGDVMVEPYSSVSDTDFESFCRSMFDVATQELEMQNLDDQEEQIFYEVKENAE